MSVAVAKEERLLPDGWRWVRLGDVCSLVGGSVNPLDSPDEVFAHYSIPAFDAGMQPRQESGAEILSNKVCFPNGSVLFSKLNPRISRVWHVADQHLHRRICSTEFLPFQPSPQIDSRYLVFALQEPGLISDLRSRVAAATKSRERLRPEVILAAAIPLPPLPAQRRIAAKLTGQMAAVDTARAAVQAQLEAAKALPGAYLREVFESHEVSKWPKRRLQCLLEVRHDVVHPRDNLLGPAVFVGLEHIESGTGHRTGSIAVEKSRLTGRKPQFQPGDIVYGYLRPYLNKVWVADFEGLCSVDQYVLDTKPGVSTEFVAWFMRSPVFLERAPIKTTPGQLPRIRIEELLAVDLSMPPVNVQNSVARQLAERSGLSKRLVQGCAETKPGASSR